MTARPPNRLTEDGKFGIVYFGNEWFAENRTSSHHMARRLSEEVPLDVGAPGDVFNVYVEGETGGQPLLTTTF